MSGCSSCCAAGTTKRQKSPERLMTADSPYAAPIAGVREEDCYFYHVMDVPGHGTVGGQFDLRGAEDDYLGKVGLAGQRVLEIGPASGFLTFHMESRDAHARAGQRARRAPRPGARVANVGHLVGTSVPDSSLASSASSGSRQSRSVITSSGSSRTARPVRSRSSRLSPSAPRARALRQADPPASGTWRRLRRPAPAAHAVARRGPAASICPR